MIFLAKRLDCFQNFRIFSSIVCFKVSRCCGIEGQRYKFFIRITRLWKKKDGKLYGKITRLRENKGVRG